MTTTQARNEPSGELAARVEVLTGPCRETDAMIAVSTDCAVLVAAMLTARQAHDVGNSFADIGKYAEHLPKFTASLDAAMTLVPEGWHTKLALEDRHSHSWSWTLRGGYGVDHYARAATPALALCAAAIRARSA